ncbi:hypothetical protein [Nonomuraea sp. NPDC049695]|uniref:hypothetical protein n=1 Tax=Nonomuraea sp. NPDC049695 TaxID=3154734 RepID=UPI0034243373
MRRLAAEAAADADGLRAASRWLRVSGTRPKGSPSPVGDLLHDLTKDLLDFEARYLEARGWPAPVSVSRGADARGRAVAFLVEHLESVLAVGELTSLVEVVLGWERRLGEEPGWTPARCRCGERNLRWDARVGYFMCSVCGNHVNAVEERRLVADEAGA